MALNVVGVPAIQHFKQDLVDLLGIGLCSASIGAEGVEYPPVLLLRHQWQTEAEHKNRNDSTETPAAHHLCNALKPILISLASICFRVDPVFLADEQVPFRKEAPARYLYFLRRIVRLL